MMFRALVPLLWVLTAVPDAFVRMPGTPAAGVPPGAGLFRAALEECQEPSGNLPFYYDLYTFRGTAGKTAVVAAYAVEAGRLRNEREDGCVQYRLVVSLVLADTAIRSVERTDDSVTVRMERSPRSDHLLRTHIEVQAPPTSSTLQRVIVSDVTRPGYGQLYYGPFPIRDYRGSHLMLSDIALGESDVAPDQGWTRGDVTLALLPTGRLPQGSFDLYYEIYNLPDGNAYSTEITMERLADGGGPAPEGGEVRTLFQGEAASSPDGTLPELRHVDSQLARGRYRLTIRIRDEVTGQSAERSRDFQVGE